MMKNSNTVSNIFILFLIVATTAFGQVRIKDIVTVENAQKTALVDRKSVV